MDNSIHSHKRSSLGSKPKINIDKKWTNVTLIDSGYDKETGLSFAILSHPHLGSFRGEARLHPDDRGRAVYQNYMGIDYAVARAYIKYFKCLKRTFQITLQEVTPLLSSLKGKGYYLLLKKADKLKDDIQNLKIAIKELEQDLQISILNFEKSYKTFEQIINRKKHGRNSFNERVEKMVKEIKNKENSKNVKSDN